MKSSVFAFAQKTNMFIVSDSDTILLLQFWTISTRSNFLYHSGTPFNLLDLAGSVKALYELSGEKSIEEEKISEVRKNEKA